MLSRLAADDIVISYSRGDASAYADGLADALVKRGFAVFIDRLGTEANKEIPQTLMAKLREAQMMVLVGSPAAAASGFVGQEVREFSGVRGSDRIVPIDFENALSRSIWYDAIVGIAPEPEPLAALVAGEPAARVVARVEKAYRYTRAKDRLRRATVGALVVLGVLLAAGVGAGGYAKLKIDQAIAAEAAAASSSQRAASANAAASSAIARASDAQSRADAAQERAERLDAAASAATQRAITALQRADAEQRIALSRQLALASSEALTDTIAVSSLESAGPHPDRAALLAVEAWRAAPTREAREALHAALSFDPRIVAWLPVKDRGPPPFVDTEGQVIAGSETAVDSDADRLLVVAEGRARVTWRSSDRRIEVDSGTGWILAALAPVGRLLTVHVDRARPQVWIATRWVLEGNAARIEQRREVDLPDGTVTALAPDGRRLAIANSDAIEVLDVDSARRVRVAGWVPSRSGFVHESFAFLRRGDWLAFDEQTADDRRRVRVVETNRATEVGPTVDGRVVSTSRDGRVVLVERPEGLVATEWPEGRHVGDPLRLLRQPVDSARVSADGRWITVRVDTRRAVIDLERTQALGRRLANGVAGYSFGWPSASLIAAAGLEKMELWRVDAVGATATSVVRRSDIRSFALMQKGAGVMLADKRLAWVDDLAQSPSTRSPALDSLGLPLAGRAEGGWLFAGGERGQFYAWRRGHPALLQPSLERRGDANRQSVTRIAVNPVSGQVAVGLGGVGDGEARVKLWDPASGRLTSIADAETPTAIATSRDGRWLATGATEVMLRSWAAPFPRAWAREVGQQVESLDFAPDGSLLAVGLAGGAIELWTIPDGRVLRVGFQHDALGRADDGRRVVGVAFDPSGRWLASSDRDGDLWLWSVDPEDWARRACALAGRSLTVDEWRAQRAGDSYKPACGPPA